MMTKELKCGTLTVEDRSSTEYDGVDILVNGTKVAVVEYDSHAKRLQLRFWETDEDAPNVVGLAVPPVRKATR